MAAPSHKTSSAHRSHSQGTHRFDIVGYSVAREALGHGGRSIRSGSFGAGGFLWALVCRLRGPKHSPGQCGLAAISLELSKNDTDKDVVAMASLRIDARTGTGQYPPAVWRSGKPKTFASRSSGAVSWELAVPDAFQDYESIYVQKFADCLTIHCTVEVLQQRQEDSIEAIRYCLAVPPPPSISRDIHRLLRERRSPEPNVRFIVEDDGSEIQAHKLVLAMRSPVFHAQFLRGDMKERSARRVKIGGMSGSTSRAMLYFIYTDEQPKPKSGKCHVAMAQDLLVAADLYDLERLRIMCENTLSESIDAANVMATLMMVYGRHNCWQLEASCIDYMASDPDAYDAVQVTEEYKELDEICPSFINEITRKVARRAVTRNRSPSTSSSTGRSGETTTRSGSRYNLSPAISGTHEFTIESLSWARKMHGIGECIRSGCFQVGGYKWVMEVYPSGYTEDTTDYIDLYVRPSIDDDRTKVKATVTLKPINPTGKSLPFPRNSFMHVYASKACHAGWPKFITVESANSHYVTHDGPFTVQCQVGVITESCTSGIVNVGTVVPVPPSNMNWHLEQLLAGEEGSDIKFLIEGREIHAHKTVIAARSPVLYEAVKESAIGTDHVRIDGMRAVVFRAMLHFIYTDELPRVSNLVPGDPMEVAREMLVAACRFCLKRMKCLCVNLLAKVARCHNLLELEEYCRRYMSLPHVTNKAT